MMWKTCVTLFMCLFKAAIEVRFVFVVLSNAQFSGEIIKRYKKGNKKNC